MAELRLRDALPPAIRRHLRVPLYLFPLWLLLLGAVVAAFRYVDRSAADTPDTVAGSEAGSTESPGETRTITIGGEADFQITVQGETVTLSGTGLDGLVLTGDEDELRLRDPSGHTRFRLKKKDEEDKAKLYDASGTVVYRIKVDPEDKLKIRTPDNTDLYRIKVKEDKFNVMNSAGTRILKGKFKKGRIVVRTDPGEKTVLTVDGAEDLEEAAYLAAPVEPGYRVLLWKAFTGPGSSR